VGELQDAAGVRGRRRASEGAGAKIVPVEQAVGLALAHDLTEVRQDGGKGAAFRRGYVVREEDLPRLRRCVKEHVFILDLAADELHEDEAAVRLAAALCGEGVAPSGPPREGRVDLTAARDGLLKIDGEALYAFNLLGEVMCATLHTDTLVQQGQRVAGTRAIPLVVREAVVREAVRRAGSGVIAVRELARPRVGVVVTGSEVSRGLVQDRFGPLLERKVAALGGGVVGVRFAPDDEGEIAARLGELRAAGANLLVATGGMSVDPDDRTRFAADRLGARDVVYGAAALPGSMCLVAYLPGANGEIPLIGLPACALAHEATVFDLILPRLLAGERLGRRELAALGHGGLCLRCEHCDFPRCPFGK
jgi:hypothetical protein